MAKVFRCEVDQCAYNLGKMCHAIGITVGGTDQPVCQTFCRFMTDSKGGDIGCVGCVGACKKSSCLYNVALQCQAEEIIIGHCRLDAGCMTFKESEELVSNGAEVSSSTINSGFSSKAPELFIG